MTSFEFGKARHDQVTSERLQDARAVVARIGELDPSSIDSLTLANRLQGLSRAISDIVVARGTVEVTRLTNMPSFDPTIMPAEVTDNVLTRFDDSNTRTGRFFQAHSIWGYGVTMSVAHMGTSGESSLYEASVLSDQMIDAILLQEPALWDNMFACSHDFRSGQPVDAYPFHIRFYDEAAPSRYLSTVQELSAELLTVSA